MRTLSLFRLLAVAGCVFLAACLGDDPVAPRIENTTFHPSLGVDLDASTRTNSGLYYRDISVGSGALASAGSAVSVRYKGALVNGVVFDSGGASRTPVNFRIGGPGVRMIPGFEEGTVGMRVGGARQIIIPPHLGYGSEPSSSIPGNSILVFTLELLSVS